MVNVTDLMSKQLFTLNQSDSIKSAKSLISLVRIRHIPIVDSDMHFVGLITHRDILASSVSMLADITEDEQDEIDTGIPVSALMRTDVTVISPDTSLKQAATILYNNKFGCLPVVDDQEVLLGIVTEADFLRLTISLLDALGD